MALRGEEEGAQREQPPVRIAEALGQHAAQRARQVEQRRAYRLGVEVGVGVGVGVGVEQRRAALEVELH